MRRVVFRAFASEKKQGLTQAELDIVQKTAEFQRDVERKEWAKNFASDSDADHYQVQEVKENTDSTPVAVEYSSDEEVVPFFIDDLKQVQYVYKPKAALEFDSSGFACIFQKQRSLLRSEKFRYCRSLYWSYFLSAYFFLNHVYFGSLAPVVALIAPSLVLSRALITDEIAVNKEGTHLRFTTRRFRFLRGRQWVCDIRDFGEPKGQKFGLWNVYEFPDDLKTYSEVSSLTKYAYVKRLSLWSFLLLPSAPDFVNREILVNALNGVYIDTDGGGAEDLQQRYVVMDRKDLKD